MKKHFRFSVIIPTYNRSAFLAETLESVSGQSFVDYECLVVDDGSTDDTVGVVSSYPFVRLLRQSNLGPSTARNRGAAEATGDYLVFLDSDDLWFPWTLNVLNSALNKSEDPELAALAFIEFSDSEKLPIVDLPPTETVSSRYETPAEAVLEADLYVGAGTMCIDRQLFLKVGGFREDIINCEDHDLFLRIIAARGMLKLTSPPMIAWRRHSGSTTFNVARTLHGITYLIERERRADYPGGDRYRKLRRRFIASRSRPIVISLLTCGHLREGIRIAWATCSWDLRPRRLWFYIYCLGLYVRFWLFSFYSRGKSSEFT